jgi:uncharacterized membrane protein YhaH (DUF805 family)
MEKQESDYNMIDWWKKAVFHNYANFRGRAGRSEYWYFLLFNIILFVPLFLILIIAGENDNESFSGIGIIIIGLGFVGLIIPWLSVVVRRLHDLNKSGWNYFVRLIPIVGPILLLVWLCKEGNPYRNNYGEDPKNASMPEFDFDNKE